MESKKVILVLSGMLMLGILIYLPSVERIPFYATLDMSAVTYREPTVISAYNNLESNTQRKSNYSYLTVSKFEQLSAPSGDPKQQYKPFDAIDKYCVENKKYKRERLSQKREDVLFREGYKKILVWNSNWNYGKREGFVLRFRSQYFKSSCCLESRCVVTDDRTMFPLQQVDAVIMQLRGLKELPETRTSKTRWVFFESESASYTFNDPSKYNNLFNWTMTYRKDSDIQIKYGYVERYLDGKQHSPSQSFKIGKETQVSDVNKSIDNREMAAWMVSNCKTKSNREAYVKNLQRYIKVDIYGRCGELKCSKDNMKRCYSLLESKYKFYLSFENSVCKDYVTEKFFSILNYRMVPVVYGGADYSLFAPPHSYINAMNFESEKSLAEYLLYLDKNVQAYNEYFRWKDFYYNYPWGYIAAIKFCSLCHRLHNDNEEKVYTDMDKWFLGDAGCKRITPL